MGSMEVTAGVQKSTTQMAVGVSPKPSVFKAQRRTRTKKRACLLGHIEYARDAGRQICMSRPNCQNHFARLQLKSLAELSICFTR